jgi:hypothetical protein
MCEHDRCEYEFDQAKDAIDTLGSFVWEQLIQLPCTDKRGPFCAQRQKPYEERKYEAIVEYGHCDKYHCPKWSEIVDVC